MTPFTNVCVINTRNLTRKNPTFISLSIYDMKKHLIIYSIFLLGLLCFTISAQAQTEPANSDTAIKVPVGGNAWVNARSKASVTDSGLMNWSDAKDIASIWIRTEAKGILQLACRLRVPQGNSQIQVIINNSSFTKKVANTSFQTIEIGNVTIDKPGYICIRLKGIKRSGPVYAEVSDLVLKGSALSGGAVYVKNNKGNYFYWGRRGSSVHLNYKVPAAIQHSVEWFYNEVTVPVGEDTQGSYFMSNGFAEGYFGMQVNSPTERHVLFSIWSPFTTDDPKSIPDSLKIQLIKKGPNVHAGEFGSEGSGGQSYMNYMWKTGNIYCFLTHAKPDAATNTTTFTCYFKAATDSAWQLIASFKRPKTNNHLTQLYSFLENFDPDYGNIERKGNYGNGWVVDTAGNWYELTDALFTGDATANIKYRKDYAGGVENNLFYLRNCGFFNDFTPLKTTFHRLPGTNGHPVINFNELP